MAFMAIFGVFRAIILHTFGVQEAVTSPGSTPNVADIEDSPKTANLSSVSMEARKQNRLRKKARSSKPCKGQRRRNQDPKP